MEFGRHILPTLLTTALLCLRAVGESSSIPGANGLGRLDPGGVESTFQIPAPPTLTPAQPPPPSNDRQKSQVAAKALGLGAAAQEKVQCYYMMSEAMKPENEAHKDMMMMMAMQMCAQADQMMMAAMKNDEGRKQISANDIPKQAELKVNNAQIGQDKIKEAQVPKITFNDEATKTSSSGAEIPAPSRAAIPDLNALNTAKPEGKDDLKPPFNQFVNPEVTTPERIADAVKKEESGKNDIGPTVAALGLGGGFGFGGPGKGSQGGDRGVASTSSSGDSSGGGGGGGRKRDRIVTGGESGGGGGAEGKSGGMDFQALLDQMMGGPQAAAEAGASSDVIILRRVTDEEPPPNLFEYAAWRYKKLADEKGAIARRKKGKKTAALTKATVATASKILTEAAQKIDTPNQRGN